MSQTRVASAWVSIIAAVTAVLVAGAQPAQTQIIETIAGGGPNGIPALEACFGRDATVVAGGPDELFVTSEYVAAVLRIQIGGDATIVAGNRGYCATIPDPNLGGPATTVSLWDTAGLVRAPSGDLYFSDMGRYIIVKIEAATGVATRIAGTGVQGDSGDGGPATSAELMLPIALALDSAGNLYFADTGADRVRRIDAATGIITTVAGTGVSGYSGDGGPAIAAEINHPQGLALDSEDNLYISDTNNCRVRRVDAATEIITTVVGTGSCGYEGDGGPAAAARISQPFGLFIDSSDSLCIADRANHRVRVVTGGIISTAAGTGTSGYSGDGGLATSARLNNPQRVAKDTAGNLLIHDSDNRRIRRVLAASGIIETVAGSGRTDTCGDGHPATWASLTRPQGVALNRDGDLLVSEGFLECDIRRIDGTTGLISTFAGSGSCLLSGDGGPAVLAGMLPDALAVDLAGNVFFAESLRHRVRRIDAATGNVTTVAGTGVAGSGGDGGPAVAAQLNQPSGVAVDTDGNLYIGDTYNHRIRRVSVGGTISTVAGTGVAGFAGDGGAATSARINYPRGVALDSAGRLLIADYYNNRVRRVSGGIITTFAGNGANDITGDGGPATAAAVGSPRDVAVDASDRVYIAQLYGTGRVRRVSPTTSVITSVAGGGTCFGQNGGDGGPAQGACLGQTLRLGLDTAGNLLIVEPYNSRVRRVILSADLQISKADSADPVLVGSPLTYTLTVTNNGPGVVGAATVVDTLPVGLAFVSATAGCTVDGQTVTCVTPSLAVGGSAVFTIEADVLPAAAPSLANTATVTSDQPDPDLANNTASETTAVVSADLSVTQTDSPDPVAPGLVVTYTVTVSNAGPSDATSVVLTDTLPAGATFQSAPANCSHDSGVVTCTWASIPAAQMRSVAIYVWAPASAGEIVNHAHVESATYDPTTPNDDDETTIVFAITANGELPFLAATSREGVNVVQWLNPASGPYVTTMLRVKDASTFAECDLPGGFPADPTDGALLTTQADGGVGHVGRFEQTSVLSTRTYCYSAFVYKGNGEYSPARHVKARPIPAASAIAWGYSTGAASLSPPGVGSWIYAVSNDNVLHAMVRGASGGEWPATWTPFGMSGPATHRPSALVYNVTGATSVVYLASSNGSVYAVNAASGAWLWDSAASYGMLLAAPMAWQTRYGGDQDYLLFGTRNAGLANRFVALDPLTGDQAPAPWGDDQLALSIGGVIGSATLDYVRDSAYFTTLDGAGTVWSLRLDTGGIRWSSPLANVTTAATLRGNRVYVGTNTAVYALDADSGATVWSYPTNDGPVKGFIFPDRTSDDLYFSTDDTVWSLSDAGSEATLNWSDDTITTPSTPLFLIGESLAYVGSGDGYLYQLDFTSGTPVEARVLLGDGLAAVGVPMRDSGSGLVHVGSEAGVVYAVTIPLVP